MYRQTTNSSRGDRRFSNPVLVALGSSPLLLSDLLQLFFPSLLVRSDEFLPSSMHSHKSLVDIPVAFSPPSFLNINTQLSFSRSLSITALCTRYLSGMSNGASALRIGVGTIPSPSNLGELNDSVDSTDTRDRP